MTDLEKILTGLAACMPQTEDDAAIGCDGCPYNGHPCGGDYQDNDHVNLPVRLIEDIRALLKAQEPRLLTLDEIHDSMVVYLEAGTKFLKIVDDDGVVLAIGGSERTGTKCFITVWDVGVAAKDDEYNVTWRAWSERPTKEQREKEPWNRRANDDER